MHPTYAAGRKASAMAVPYVLRPAGGLEPWRLRRGYLRSLKKKMYLELVAKPVMKRAACLQAASMQELESLRRVGYRGPVAIIPGGVDAETLSACDTSESNEYWPELRDRPVVLFMSRLSPEKGLDLLIPLWADLVKAPAHREALLVLAGPSYRGYRETVEAMIERHDLQPHVRVTGMVQGPKKRALLSRADVFVLPSYSENFGIVVPEALACQTPVVTTTGTPWQQLQTIDAGRQVLPTKDQLAEALRELLEMSSSQRDAMGRRGRDLVQQHYTWQKVAGQFLTMCDCILSGRTIPLHPEPATSPTFADA
jgi:glycosyltransferase involved in cell wall biosynthesis